MQGQNETQSAGGAVADLNPVGPPPGADLGDVFTDQQGKEWLFEQFEDDPGGKWYPTITNLKESPSPVVIENDKYYRPTANGYIESGLVYSDAIKGRDLIQKMNEWQVEAEQRIERNAMQRYAEYAAAQQKQAVYDYNVSRHPIGLIYLIGLDPLVQTYKKVQAGNYAAASVDVAIMLVCRIEKPLTQGFRSFSAFKRAMGSAGEGKAWHHIVEQTPGNVGRFGAEIIHNTGNIIKLPHGGGSIHARLSGYYSSIQPTITGSSTMTVRQWLSTKSYQFQYDFGIQKLKDFGWKF